MPGSDVIVLFSRSKPTRLYLFSRQPGRPKFTPREARSIRRPEDNVVLGFSSARFVCRGSSAGGGGGRAPCEGRTPGLARTRPPLISPLRLGTVDAKHA